MANFVSLSYSLVKNYFFFLNFPYNRVTYSNNVPLIQKEEAKKMLIKVDVDPDRFRMFTAGRFRYNQQDKLILKNGGIAQIKNHYFVIINHSHHT